MFVLEGGTLAKTSTKLFKPSKGIISSKYGIRRGKFHTGIDFLPNKGKEVVAAKSGSVIHASTKGGYGKTIIIYHGNGLSTWYCHLNKINVLVADQVKQGDLIGIMGSSGKSTGNHLHFEVRIGKKHANPLEYFR